MNAFMTETALLAAGVSPEQAAHDAGDRGGLNPAVAGVVRGGGGGGGARWRRPPTPTTSTDWNSVWTTPDDDEDGDGDGIRRRARRARRARERRRTRRAAAEDAAAGARGGGVSASLGAQLIIVSRDTRTEGERCPASFPTPHRPLPLARCAASRRGAPTTPSGRRRRGAGEGERERPAACYSTAPSPHHTSDGALPTLSPPLPAPTNTPAFLTAPFPPSSPRGRRARPVRPLRGLRLRGRQGARRRLPHRRQPRPGDRAVDLGDAVRRAATTTTTQPPPPPLLHLTHISPHIPPPHLRSRATACARRHERACSSPSEVRLGA